MTKKILVLALLMTPLAYADDRAFEGAGSNATIAIGVQGVNGMKPVTVAGTVSTTGPSTVVQPTASLLNAQVVGSSSAGASLTGINPLLMGMQGTDGKLRIPRLGFGNVIALLTDGGVADGLALANVLTMADYVGNEAVPATANMVYDPAGNNWKYQRGNASGAFSQGQAADGVAVAGNPIRMAIKDGSGNTQDVVGNTEGVPSALSAITFADNQSNNGGMFLDATGGRVLAGVAGFGFNGTGWDRFSSNQDITLLTSAARTTTTSASPPTNNFNARGVWVVLNITVVPGADTVTLKIEARDTVSGLYVTLLTGAAQVGTGTTEYSLYPGVTETANVDVSRPLPRNWRITVTHSAATSFTYSVGASLVN
jgi:hypothetical protein